MASTDIAPLTFLQAIAREEGFYMAGSRANRNRNPGNIVYDAFSTRHGAIKSDGRFAIFPTVAAGFGCMVALFQNNYKGLTIAQAIARYAPSTENNTAQYILNVCAWSDLTPETPVDAHLFVPVPLAAATPAPSVA